MRKKLKDLKKGDKMWWQGYTDTTPIYVVKVKRDGDLCTVTVKWDDTEYVCFGHALSFTCVGYCRKFCNEEIFTTDYETLKSEEDKREKDKRYAQIGRNVVGIMKMFKEL